MLNELYSLSEALNKAGIARPDWHINYLELPGGKTIRIFLNAAGEVEDFDCLDTELTAKLRKYGNNQGSFPAFNMQSLYRLAGPELVKKYKELSRNPENIDFSEIRDWCTGDNWDDSHTQQIDRCIIGKSTELRHCVEQVSPDEENSLTALIRALTKNSDNCVAKIRASLEERALAKLRGGEDAAAALTILFHDKKFSVILDCAGWREYGYPVASEKATEWMNAVLLKATNPDSPPTGSQEELDAFGTPLKGDEIRTMPKVKLDGVEIILRSMYNQVPCQERYTLFDSDSFPISDKNRSIVKKALEYLSQPENNGKTWTRIEPGEILFAYPSVLPRQAPVPDMIRLMVESGETIFEECAKRVIKAIDRLAVEFRPKNIRVFSLRKMDRARTKVVFTRNMTTDHYIGSAVRWQDGCANIPKINPLKPLTPFPLDISSLCNTIWKQDGETATVGESPKGSIHFYQGVDLLLDVEDREKLLWFLRPLVRNSRGIFLFVGNHWHRANLPRLSDSRYKKLRKLVPLLGLLLYKGGYDKETYMERSAYNLGQLLKACDELHAMYCLVKRDGDVPPQLVGNSVFAMASETPIKAMAVLRQRMPPYLAWAKQYGWQKKAPPDSEQKPGIARWYLRLFAHFSEKLDGLRPATRFGEFEQAQVFLGYLANFPKRAVMEDKEDLNGEERNDD